MGACEPEPVLDFGWFTEPARRAMLVHTKSFGASGNSEDVINRYGNYTDVNNLAKYAITKRIFVKIIDKDRLPVSNVQVEYQLYNYAEFYPLAVVPTDENGISQFETGFGDLMIWAHKGDKFDFKKISVGETDTLTMQLSLKPQVNNSIDLDLDVPVIHSPLAGPSNELLEKNTERFNQENKIRQKYIESWMKTDEAKSLALKLKTDTSRVDKIIARSMGNYKEICSFLSQTPDSLITRALSLLEILPDKDLRDVKAYILSDHLANSFISANDTGECDVKTFIDYILNPRVANEMLVAWRHYFLTNLPSELVLNATHNPLLIVQYLNDNIRINEDENYYKTPLTPVGVNELKVSDSGSRAICFVAICRSLGIPSRLEPGRNVPQYFSENKWTDVYFSDQQRPDPDKGFLKLHSFETNPVPEYYIQFTIARFENGRYNTLEYDFNKKITDFKNEIPLPPGHYMLVTGNRLINSKILSSITFFDLAENEHKTIEVKIRKDLSEKNTFGSIDIMKIDSAYNSAKISESCTNDKRLVIIWADPEKEPTKHIFNDLLLLKSELDAWGGKFLIFTIGTGKDQTLFVPANTINSENTKGLPENTSFFIDNQLSVLKNSLRLNKPADMILPVVIVTDRSGKIYFISTGYRIGIGEQILKYLK
jgi:hypothetical protein